MQFTLTDAKGKVLSQTSADNASYSGPTPPAALTLIQEKADDEVAQLYSDYCRAPVAEATAPLFIHPILTIFGSTKPWRSPHFELWPLQQPWRSR